LKIPLTASKRQPGSYLGKNGKLETKNFNYENQTFLKGRAVRLLAERGASY
jgi:hypothetical protein